MSYHPNGRYPKPQRGWRSGFCPARNSQPWQHERCAGVNPNGIACICDCHTETKEAPMSATTTRAPGFYDDIPEAEYHADPDSLSVSGAKVLLKAPALYRHRQEHPEHKDVFDIGSAAHALVLGVGAPLFVVDADSWRTKEAREARDKARADGMTPLLTADHQRVIAMADALSSHRMAMKLLSGGKPEVSAYAIDEPTGVMRRARFDYIHDDVITDYKSCASAEPGAFARAAANFGYHQQAAWYLDLAHDLGHGARGFVFIAQEKEPPYLVSTVELVPSALDVGRDLNRRALERFRDCRDSGVWPGYSRDDEITPIDLPGWAYYQNQEIPA